MSDYTHNDASSIIVRSKNSKYINQAIIVLGYLTQVRAAYTAREESWLLRPRVSPGCSFRPMPTPIPSRSDHRYPVVINRNIEEFAHSLTGYAACVTQV